MVSSDTGDSVPEASMTVRALSASARKASDGFMHHRCMCIDHGLAASGSASASGSAPWEDEVAEVDEDDTD